MKKATYFIVYTATLVIGVLLLIFSQEPMTRTDPVSLRTVVIASGIVYIAIGIISFLFSLRKKRNSRRCHQDKTLVSDRHVDCGDILGNSYHRDVASHDDDSCRDTRNISDHSVFRTSDLDSRHHAYLRSVGMVVHHTFLCARSRHNRYYSRQ